MGKINSFLTIILLYDNNYFVRGKERESKTQREEEKERRELDRERKEIKGDREGEKREREEGRD